MSNQQVFKWLFMISCSLLVVTYFYKDTLPEPTYYDISLLQDPIQTNTTRDPFSIEVNKQHYSLTPRFDYDLTGVVVSYSNANSFTDIWHYDDWKDFINVRDLCVIWGKNVSSGVYKKLDFSSDTWTCWFSWRDEATGQLFKWTDISNNHLLTENNQIKKQLMEAEIGDVVHFKGILTDYHNVDNGGWRKTSIKRTDTGNGACEVVYLDEFDIIKKAHPSLRHFYSFMKWITLFCFTGWMLMFFMTPFKA